MIYISLLIVLLFFSFLDYSIRSTYSLQKRIYALGTDIDKSSGTGVLISVTGALLFFWFLYATIILGFRGDFSADYNSYTVWFQRMNEMSRATFWESFGIHHIFSTYMETGYAVLNRIVGHFTKNPVWLFFVCAVIICFPVHLLSRKSDLPWLVILLWISIGPYLEGFNTMRGAMAASILILSLRYLYERKPIRYVIAVLLATMFHSIAILMLFAYFLPMIKPSRRNAFIIIIVAVAVSVSGEILATRFNSIFHIAADDSGALTLLYRYNSSGASLLISLLIEALALYMFFDEAKKGEFSLADPYIRMMYNGNLIWILFKLLTIFTGYSTRFAMLFFYYPCMLIPFLVKRRESKFLYYLIIILSSSWYLINVLFRYPAYYFAF